MATVLSGMSGEGQMRDNLDTFTEFEPISESERALLRQAVEVMQKSPVVPCTNCRYCMDGCPQHLPITRLLKEASEKLDVETGG